MSNQDNIGQVLDPTSIPIFESLKYLKSLAIDHNGLH